MNTATNTSKAVCHCSTRVIGRNLCVGSKLNTGDDPEEPLTLKLYCVLSVSVVRRRAKSTYSSAHILDLIFSGTRPASGTEMEVNVDVGLSTGPRSPVMLSTTERIAPSTPEIGVLVKCRPVYIRRESHQNGAVTIFVGNSFI